MPDGRRATDEDGLERWWAWHLREHEAEERSRRREHDAEQRALDIATGDVNRRLGELNVLRSEVIKDRSQFIREDTYKSEHRSLVDQVDALVKALTARIDAVEKSLDRAEGAVNTWRFIAGFLGLGGVALIVWSLATFGHP